MFTDVPEHLHDHVELRAALGQLRAHGMAEAVGGYRAAASTAPAVGADEADGPAGLA